MEYQCIRCRGVATLLCKCVDPNLAYCEACYSSHVTPEKSHIPEKIGERKVLGPKLRDLSRLVSTFVRQKEDMYTCVNTIKEIMIQTETWAQSQTRMIEEALEEADRCIGRVQELEKIEELEPNNALESFAVQLDHFTDSALDNMLKILSISINHSYVNFVSKCVTLELFESPLKKQVADCFPKNRLKPAVAKEERQVNLSPERLKQLELEINRLQKENQELQARIKDRDQEKSKGEAEKQIAKENTQSLVIQREIAEKEHKYQLQERLKIEQQRADQEKRQALEEMQKLNKKIKELEEGKRAIEQELRKFAHPNVEEAKDVEEAKRPKGKHARRTDASAIRPGPTWKCSMCPSSTKSEEQWSDAAAIQWPTLKTFIPDYCSKQCFENFATVAMKPEPRKPFFSRLFG